MEKDIIPKSITLKNTLRKAVSKNVDKSKAESQIESSPELANLTLRKVSQNSVKLFASYPPYTKNGSNPVVLKFKNILKDLHSLLSDD